MINWMVVLAAILGTAAFSSGQEQSAQTYKFEAEVSNVYVDAFVTHKGRPVQGLSAENFEIFDNGVRQQVRLVAPETVPLSSSLVLDTSGSVYGKKLADLRSAAHAFVKRLETKDEAALVRFSHRVSVDSELGRDPTLLHRAIDQPTYGGFTAIFDALYVAFLNVEGTEGRPLLLLFTDGDDNASWLEEQEILEMARTSEAIVYVVRVDSGSGVYFQPVAGQKFVDNETAQAKMLRRLSEATGGRVLSVGSFASLEDTFIDILKEVQNRYVLYFEPRDVPDSGWHELEVKLKNKKGDIRSRAGYDAGPAR